MGELAKRIGEVGEKTVVDFLDLIGWENTINNFDITCSNSDKHKNPDTESRRTHGIDGYFHYSSPMISKTLEHILISVKYSAGEYKSSLVADYKKDFNDITSAIECFKKSQTRNEANNSYSNINTVFDRGLIFKLNNSDAVDADIIAKLYSIDVPTGNNHDGVILIDNGRMNFLYNAISYVKKEYNTYDVQFAYFNTGLNHDDTSIKSGKILPYHYLASNIIPFRIQASDGTTILLLSSRDNFSEDVLMKLLGIAKNTGMNLQQKTVIIFPDYNELSHSQSSAKIQRLFSDDEAFSKGISVLSFNPTFRL